MLAQVGGATEVVQEQVDDGGGFAGAVAVAVALPQVLGGCAGGGVEVAVAGSDPHRVVQDGRGEFGVAGREGQGSVETPDLFAVVACGTQDGHVGERVEEERVRLFALCEDDVGGGRVTLGEPAGPPR
ncbi:hypothetical protein GCM10010326_74760 [Streptomyces xanthochromogenes]|uniref:Uncharacterized protein n=1 Tax=Streptomyces xanthochromogenes TaxID=67384 RepID=A0ABQ3AX44_9ACTN|nr:hypothetical protein GCM10010326_74760 [Streptomyces xanthochromogenes]